MTTFANDQTKSLQDAAQMVVDPNAHLDQLVTSDQQRKALCQQRMGKPY
jgi:hypothetical protein